MAKKINLNAIETENEKDKQDAAGNDGFESLTSHKPISFTKFSCSGKPQARGIEREI